MDRSVLFLVWATEVKQTRTTQFKATETKTLIQYGAPVCDWLVAISSFTRLREGASLATVICATKRLEVVLHFDVQTAVVTHIFKLNLFCVILPIGVNEKEYVTKTS